MAQDAPSPTFGSRESDDNVPYTQYYDEVLKVGRERNLGKSNDTHENPDALPKDEGPVQCRPSDSPLHHDIVARKLTSDSPLYQIGDQTISGDQQRKARRSNGGHDRSIEQSPLHRHYQVKYAGKGDNSPSSEIKGSAEGIHAVAPNTPGKIKLRTVRGDDMFEKSSTVPRFGEWDENNPSSADRFSDIFEKVRKEKQDSSAKAPIITDDSQYINAYHQDKNSTSTKCWCFSWCKK